MSALQAIINSLYAFLKANGPYNGTRYDLAAALGVGYVDLDNALHRIRSAEFQANNGWSIPKQARGDGPKDWRVIDLADGPIQADEYKSHVDADTRVRNEVENVLNGAIAQLDIVYGKLDHRSTRGRQVNRTMQILTGVTASLQTV